MRICVSVALVDNEKTKKLRHTYAYEPSLSIPVNHSADHLISPGSFRAQRVSKQSDVVTSDGIMTSQATNAVRVGSSINTLEYPSSEMV